MPSKCKSAIVLIRVKYFQIGFKDADVGILPREAMVDIPKIKRALKFTEPEATAALKGYSAGYAARKRLCKP